MAAWTSIIPSANDEAPSQHHIGPENNRRSLPAVLQCVLKDGLHEVISRELEGRFLDFASIQDGKQLTILLNFRKKITDMSFFYYLCIEY